MRYFIASFLLFISAFSSAQTELLDAKKIWARDSIRLGSNWIRSLSKDTALLTVTDRDIPSAKAVKDFVLNRKSKTDSLLNLKMDKTDSSDLLSKTVRTFGNQSGITGNKTFTNNLTANSFIRASGTPDQLMVANGDVQSKADIHNGAVTFDTTARTLTIPTLSGGSYSVVIPRGTSSGAEGITALSYSRTGNLVTVAGDNGSSTTFSIRDADSSVLAKLSDSTLFNAGRWLPNRNEDSIKVIRALVNSKGVGTVTGVTASGPLSSSGGASPNITISQANSSTNGFLSSTDWNTFNNKVSYTDALARVALSFSAGSGGYNSSTGVITIPTNTNQITNGAGFITLADSNAILKDRWLPNRIADSLATIRQLANTKGVGTVTSVSASAGTGISVSGSPITGSGTITITNTAPDQVVTLTAGTGISISGTYPNFTVTNSSPSTGGTVTSVGLSAPTGFSVGGSPVTSSGTLALNFASGYSLPTTASQSLWDVAYSKRMSSASLTSSQLTLTLGDASTVTASVPTFNQNTTGTAASLSAVLSSTLGGAGATNGILKANGSGVVSAVVASDITSLISGTYVDLTTNQTVGGVKTFTNGARGFGFTALGTAGGWDRAFSFEGSTGTNRGGFGAFGADNALNYYYIGSAFNSNIARFDGTTLATTLYGALSGTSVAFSGAGSFGTSLGIAGGVPSGSNVLVANGSALLTGGLAVGSNITLGNAFNLTWGGNFGANIPTIIGVSGSGSFLTFYPSGSTNGEAARFANDGTFLVNTTTTDGVNKAIISGGFKVINGGIDVDDATSIIRANNFRIAGTDRKIQVWNSVSAYIDALSFANTGAATFNSSVTIGTGTYNNYIISNVTAASGYSQTFQYKGVTVPGSGTAKLLSHFANNAGGGTLQHDVLIDGGLTVGNSVNIATGYNLNFNNGTDAFLYADNSGGGRININGTNQLQLSTGSVARLTINNTGAITASSNFKSAGLYQPISFKTSNYTLTANDYTVIFDVDGASRTATLPAGVEGQIFHIGYNNTVGNSLTIVPNGSQTIAGGSSFVINSGTCIGAVTIQFLSGNWYIIATAYNQSCL